MNAIGVVTNDVVMIVIGSMDMIIIKDSDLDLFLLLWMRQRQDNVT